MTQVEILLDPLNARDALYPIVYQEIWDYYKQHQASVWFAEEIDFSKDLNDWKLRMNEDEKKYMKSNFAFFAGSDLLVNDNESENLNEITVPEHKMMTINKMDRENVHTETYANMLETFVEDIEEREMLKSAIKTIPAIKKKADWFKKYIKDGSFVERKVTGAITEGIGFSGSFCAIFWVKKQGKMAGVCDANELIAREEGIHRDYACMLYRNFIVNKLPKEQVIKMIKEYVEIEIEYCTESIPVTLIGMNSSEMSEYIKYVGDHLAVLLINETIYNVKNPFPWTIFQSLDSKTDFFAHRVNNYSRQKVITNKEENKIVFDCEY